MFLKSSHWPSRVAVVVFLFRNLMEKFPRVRQAVMLVLL
jgi:hypothetical protein